MKRYLVPLLFAWAAAPVHAEWLTMLGDPRDPAVNIVQVDPSSLVSAEGRGQTRRPRVGEARMRTSTIAIGITMSGVTGQAHGRLP